MSRRKYFKFWRFFGDEFRAVCGKKIRLPVENSVENFASGFEFKFNKAREF
jgi:hypothetical protein